VLKNVMVRNVFVCKKMEVRRNGENLIRRALRNLFSIKCFSSD